MKNAAHQDNNDPQGPRISSEMIKAINGWLFRLGEQQGQQNRVVLNIATIIAIIKHANKLETGHGTVTLTIKQNKFHAVSHEETELLPQSKFDLDM